MHKLSSADLPINIIKMKKEFAFDRGENLIGTCTVAGEGGLF